MKKYRPRRQLSLALLLSLTALCFAGAPFAQNYPARPVRLIVPFAPGGTTDVLARLVAQKLADALGQQFLVDNRPGAGGNIGTELAVKSPADGYTLVMSFDGTMAINPGIYRTLAFDAQKDLAPVASVAQVPLLLVVHPGVAASNIAEFVALSKASPGRVNYSSAGHGSTGHLTGELFRARAGIDIVHVNYKGGGQAVQDLLGGQIQMLVTALPTVEGHLKGGRLRALAFTSARRVPGAPAVATLAESGYPEFDVLSWYGILAPAGTPQDIVRSLNAQINRILQAADVRARLALLGAEPTGGTPEQFAATIRADTARWARVVSDAGIRID
ncbi:MAG: tripartite tricarboxylate transporter substrate binding protein [Betaproteobacteria bacterium]|nr:tripartite tricarboxylate transporter substrate binding protein [Betaproteobacteria bacterium]